MSKKDKKFEKALEEFKKEAKNNKKLSKKLAACKNSKETNKVLKKWMKKNDIKTPWEKQGYSSFDEFMKDPKSKMVY